MVEIIESVEGLSRLETVWRSLESGADMGVFQTYDWTWCAWNDYLSLEPKVRLWVVHWHQGEDNVIFPFYIDRKGTLRFIHDTHSDILNAIYSGNVNRHNAYRETVVAIMEEKRIKSVWLQKMPGYSESLNHFGVLLHGSLAYKDHAYSWLDVPKSDDFIKAAFAHMRSKDRADLKALNRKSMSYSLDVLSEKNGDAFPTDGIAELVGSMLNSTDRNVSFFPLPLQHFAEDMYRRSVSDIAVLRDNAGSLIALNFLLKSGDKYLSWIFLYNNPKASTSLYCRLMDLLGRKKSFVLDFGVGAYMYKIGTFRPSTALTFSLRFGKTPYRQALGIAAMNWRVLKDYLKWKLKVGHR